MPDFNPSFVVHEIQLYDETKWNGWPLPSLDIVIEPMPGPTAEEECLLYLKQLDKTRIAIDLALAAHKEQVQAKFAQAVRFSSFQEGDFVSLYHPKDNLLEACMLRPIWLSPYFITKVLPSGAYELQDWDGNPLKETTYELYLKKYFS